VVDAAGNSSSGGVGVSTIALTAGKLFQVSVDPNDLWSAGSLPRWSNADGLTGPLTATGSDKSGAAAGTLVGQSFGILTRNGFSASYGTLVGELNGVFHVIGANFSGAAWDTGTLNLFYWDSNSSDNSGSVAANVSAATTAVPEPASWGLMILGSGVTAALLRRRRATASIA
jgi:hypothetical protein